MVTAALVISGAYLWGAVPSAYLAGRYLKGIDIRRFGSGNVGASNLMEHVGKWTGFGVGAFDSLGKGALVMVASDLLGQTLAVQAAAGVATIAGHNWSVYMRFTGGRGVATAIGVLIGVWMWQALLTLAIVMGLIGRLIARDTGLWTFLSMLALPPLAAFFGEPPEYVYMTVAISVTVALKRLTANWEAPGGDYGFAQVLAFRLLWDRDVPRRAKWTNRRPVDEDNAHALDV